jgi:hypothetical protein
MNDTITLPETKIKITTRQPPETRGRKLSPVMDKIMLLEPGQVAEVRGTINLHSLLSAIGSKKRQEKTGRKFTIRKVDGGADIYRIS